MKEEVKYYAFDEVIDFLKKDVDRIKTMLNQGTQFACFGLRVDGEFKSEEFSLQVDSKTFIKRYKEILNKLKQDAEELRSHVDFLCFIEVKVNIRDLNSIGYYCDLISTYTITKPK